LINENPTVHQYYVTRYIDLLNTKFSCAYAIALLDSMIAEITPEMQGQINKWGGTLTAWNNNVQALRNYMNQRCTALNQGLVDCYSLSGPYPMFHLLEQEKLKLILFGLQPIPGQQITLEALLQTSSRSLPQALCLVIGPIPQDL
jgi:hypothetical protein